MSRPAAKESKQHAAESKLKRRGPARSQAVATNAVVEGTSQFTLKMRSALHRELTVLAFNSGMTMRGFVLQALKEHGLNVSDEDMVDGRRR